MSLKSSRMARHLFVIGAQRSGTTYLWHALDSHPVIYMARPVRPEPKYFLDTERVSRGYESYLESCFRGKSGVEWLGEKSTSYLECTESAVNIKAIIREPLIIVMLRDPVERAISNYFFSKQNGFENRDIADALLREEEKQDQVAGVSVSPFAYISRGQYCRYLYSWEQIFGKSHLLLLIFERFVGKTDAVSDLYSALGVDASIVPDNLQGVVNATNIRDDYVVSDEIRQALAEKFRPWNEQLADRYGLNLSEWSGMS